MPENSKKLDTNGALSSMGALRVSQSEDGSTTLTILDDTSHGYRTFTFDSKDWKAFVALVGI